MKDIFLPSYTCGVDAYHSIPKICAPYGTKIVLIGGITALEKAKTKIEQSLSEDLSVLDTIWYGGEACFVHVKTLMNHKAVQNADMIFAIGGGKALDTCKMLSNEMKKPLFCFPTVASTCAAVTAICAEYELDGVFKKAYMREKPAEHTFIDSQIIAEAPYKYMWAGIGDTLAKGYEPLFSSYGKDLDYLNRIGMTLSSLCVDPLVLYGVECLEATKENVVNDALEECVLAIIVTTGLVSNCVIFDYNTGVAHALCYGFTAVERIEEKHLHGELVSYGLLVQLMLDENYQALDRLLPFYRQIKLPTKLADLDVKDDELNVVLEKAISTADVKVLKIEVNKKNVSQAIEKLEAYVLR